MMKEKLTLKELKVQSFVCRLERCDLSGGVGDVVLIATTGLHCCMWITLGDGFHTACP